MLQQKEFHTKLNRVRQMMQQEGLDGCVLKRPENFVWMTGGGKNYLIPGVELGLCSLVVCEDALYAITNNIEAPRLKEEEQLEAFGFQLLAGIWHDDAFPENTLNKLFSGKAVGFDYPHPLGRNVAGIVQKLRYSLTEEEVAKYIEGGRLVTAAVEEVAATVRRGDTELQTLGRLASLTHSLGLEPLMLFCAADERFYKFRHPIPTQKPILERAQFGGNIRYKGLTICLNRYVNLVPVSKELERQYRANVEIDCLLIRHSVPGNTYTQALLAGKQAYEERGFWSVTRRTIRS